MPSSASPSADEASATAADHPRRRRVFGPHLATVALVAAIVILPLLAINAHHLFRAKLYEDGDLAANSLAVRQAKAFRQIYGQYSRFGFRHPGPGWFYVFAAGEWLFCDKLRVVPTPINGQLLALLGVQGTFLAAAVATAARWVREKAIFVALALIAAAVHFSAVGNEAFLSNWMPHVMAMPLLALVVSAASVAAGRGTDLPLLGLAGAALVNSHVAAPMIVGPVILAAYAGLFWSLKGERQRPWRSFPQSHIAFLCIAIFCAVPIVIDLLRGASSNMTAILAHIHAHHGEHHAWSSAAAYVLRFATYAPSQGQGGLAETAEEPGIGQYLVSHAVIFLAWTVAGLIAIAGAFALPSRNHFVRWLVAILAIAFASTLLWARIQDGAMLYFNAWYTYGLYFAVALAAVVTVADLAPARPFQLHTRRIIAGAGLLIAIAVFAARSERFQARALEGSSFVAMHNSVAKALRADGGEKTSGRLLAFPHPAWAAATGAALDLERRGYSVRVSGTWKVMFGDHIAVDDPIATVARESHEPVVWSLRPVAEEPEGAGRRPLRDGFGISLNAPALDPATQPKLSFAGPADGSAASYAPYALFGWFPPGQGSSCTSNNLPVAALRFLAAPVPADAQGVELSIDLFPVLDPGGRDHQRLALEFNGTRLGQWDFREEHPLSVVIPTTLWNARGSRPSMLRWLFLDARWPSDSQAMTDRDKMAFGFRAVAFRVIPASGPPQ